MELTELPDHAQGKEDCYPKTSVNIGVEASTAGVVSRVEDGHSRISETNDLGMPEGTGGGREDKRPKEDNGFHVVDVSKVNEEHLTAEKVCRICLSNEPSSGSSELIQLGCHCREELGISHPHCAETWFKQRGNRLCEICNKTAKNVRLIKDTNMYMIEFNDIRPMPVTTFDSPTDGSRRCKQFCNFLLTCLIVAFIVSTFFRAKIF